MLTGAVGTSDPSTIVQYLFTTVVAALPAASFVPLQLCFTPSGHTTATLSTVVFEPRPKFALNVPPIPAEPPSALMARICFVAPLYTVKRAPMADMLWPVPTGVKPIQWLVLPPFFCNQAE